jgi:hypothetical protein
LGDQRRHLLRDVPILDFRRRAPERSLELAPAFPLRDQRLVDRQFRLLVQRERGEVVRAGEFGLVSHARSPGASGTRPG